MKRGTLYAKIGLGLILFLLDRVTKYYAVHHYGDIPYRITSFLSCSLSFNRGVSWSMFHSEAMAPFIAVTALVLLLTVYIAWHAYQQMQRGVTIIGELLIIGGSLSNIVDRFVYGGVVDFIDFSCGGWSWPTFNGADASIVVGVFIMFGQLMKTS